MSKWRQAFLGIVLALLSSALILGSTLLSVVEGRLSLALAPEPTSTLVQFMPTMVFESPGLPTLTAMITARISDTPESLIPANCPPPPNWIQIQVLPGDTLQNLALAYETTPEELAAANCLITDTLSMGWLIFVPNRSATPTRPIASCGPPAGWVLYQVKPEDTLYYLSSVLNVSITQLREANCLRPTDILIAWDYIFVPFLPPPRPTTTPYPTRSNTPTRPAMLTNTATSTSVSPSSTATPTSTQPNLVTSTSTATSTQVAPTPTSTTSQMPPTSTATSPPPPPSSTPTSPPYPYPYPY